MVNDPLPILDCSFMPVAALFLLQLGEVEGVARDLSTGCGACVPIELTPRWYLRLVRVQLGIRAAEPPQRSVGIPEVILVVLIERKRLNTWRELPTFGFDRTGCASQLKQPSRIETDPNSLGNFTKLPQPIIKQLRILFVGHFVFEVLVVQIDIIRGVRKDHLDGFMEVIEPPLVIALPEFMHHHYLEPSFQVCSQ